MVKLEHYRQCVQIILTQHGSYKPKHGEVENELIFDTARDQVSAALTNQSYGHTNIQVCPNVITGESRQI